MLYSLKAGDKIWIYFELDKTGKYKLSNVLTDIAAEVIVIAEANNIVYNPPNRCYLLGWIDPYCVISYSNWVDPTKLGYEFVLTKKSTCYSKHTYAIVAYPDIKQFYYEILFNYSINKLQSGKTGVTCKLCNLINEYAYPNQQDGSYICYNCNFTF